MDCSWLVLPLALALPPEGTGALDGSPAARSVPTGPWGGAHVGLQVTADGATVEYDCAHGTISEPLRLDAEGRFSAKGTHTPEHGGPVRDGETSSNRPASYSGTVEGKQMRLTVTLAEPSETFGTFELVQGSEGELVKCR